VEGNLTLRVLGLFSPENPLGGEEQNSTMDFLGGASSTILRVSGRLKKVGSTS